MSKKQNLFILMTIVTVLFMTSFFVHKSIAQTRPTLYWGSSGPHVTDVQVKLRSWGYYKGPVDGVYKGKTVEAVKAFQKKNGLKADGVVGSGTWKALGLAGIAPARKTPKGPTVSRGVSNRDDVLLLARLITGEASGEPYEGQVAVGAVVLNRTRSSKFPNTISGVIYQPLAFESVSNGLINNAPTSTAIKAAQDAMNGWDPTYGALFFWNPAKPVSKWIWSRPIIRQIGNHVFAK